MRIQILSSAVYPLDAEHIQQEHWVTQQVAGHRPVAHVAHGLAAADVVAAAVPETVGLLVVCVAALAEVVSVAIFHPWEAAVASDFASAAAPTSAVAIAIVAAAVVVAWEMTPSPLE